MTTNERIQRDRELRAEAWERHQPKHGFVRGFILMALDILTLMFAPRPKWRCEEGKPNVRRSTPADRLAQQD